MKIEGGCLEILKKKGKQLPYLVLWESGAAREFSGNGNFPLWVWFSQIFATTDRFCVCVLPGETVFLCFSIQGLI